ncbi:MAG: hypothetical protein K5839_04235 [Treponemataceae bacterium]|nr:hypothetical protein [Treponemataceae bacterium]
MSLKKYLLLFSLLIISISVFAQNSSLPKGYDKVQLGQSVEQVKEILKKESIFGFRGDRDVSLLPTQERVLIETPGSSLFKRCSFQFYEDKLYSIVLDLNTEKMDYYSMFTSFCKKYGQPESLDPKKTEWSDESVILLLEKPLTLKYIDSKVYNSLIDKGHELKSSESEMRKNFLNSF